MQLGKQHTEDTPVRGTCEAVASTGGTVRSRDSTARYSTDDLWKSCDRLLTLGRFLLRAWLTSRRARWATTRGTLACAHEIPTIQAPRYACRGGSLESQMHLCRSGFLQVHLVPVPTFRFECGLVAALTVASEGGWATRSLTRAGETVTACDTSRSTASLRTDFSDLCQNERQRPVDVTIWNGN